MRGTIHVVSRRDYWPFAVAIRAAQREWVLRSWKPRPDERELEGAARKLDTLMAEGPRRQDELGPGGRALVVGPWLEVVRVPPSGTWEKRRAHLFQTAERWVGPEDVDEAHARDHLVGRYLAAFGPASRKDIASGRAYKAVISCRWSSGCRSAASVTRRAASSSTSPVRRSQTPTLPRPCGSSRPGTPCSSSTPGARESSRSSTGR